MTRGDKKVMLFQFSPEINHVIMIITQIVHFNRLLAKEDLFRMSSARKTKQINERGKFRDR